MEGSYHTLISDLYLNKHLKKQTVYKYLRPK